MGFEMVSALVQENIFLTISLIIYIPVSLYLCFGSKADEVSPSPKSQKYFNPPIEVFLISVAAAIGKNIGNKIKFK